MTGLLHPQTQNGRTLWVDTGMDDLIKKIHHGDPVLGWEGDERLAVYANQTQGGMVFELWRLEEDEQYRHVMHTQPNDPFDHQIIRWLVENDKRRKPKGWSLDAEIKEHNTALDDAKEQQRKEWVREEFGPRLLHAVRKDM
jgi:hypothetical protein